LFPVKAFVDRFGEILAELDALAASRDSEALEELNAEFEDALLLLGELKPQDEDFDEDLADTLEELRALAGDYRALSESLPDVAEPARRLEMAVALAEGGA